MSYPENSGVVGSSSASCVYTNVTDTAMALNVTISTNLSGVGGDDIPHCWSSWYITNSSNVTEAGENKSPICYLDPGDKVWVTASTGHNTGNRSGYIDMTSGVNYTIKRYGK